MAQSQPESTTAATVESVVVTARRPSLQVLSDTLQNTPQTVTILPQEVLEQQGVNNLQQALKNVPGITLNAGEGGTHGDNINLRGFPASDDFFLEGLRDTGFYTRDSFDIQTIEVYKGPASTLFGRGSTGGVVNQVSKSPLLSPLYAATFTGGTNSEVRGTADINYVLAPTVALRVDAMGFTSGVAGRPDFVVNKRWGVAPTLGVGLGTPTTFAVSYLHQQEDNVPDYGFPFFNGAPVPAPHDAYYGLPDDDRVTSDVNVVTARLAHDFGDGLSLSETARYGNYGFGSHITAPHYGVSYSDTDPSVASCSNNGPGPTPGLPIEDQLICRDRPSADGTITTAMSLTELSYRFVTGPLVHNFVASLDIERETADLVRYANQISQIAPTPLLDPDPFEPFPGHQTTVTSRPDTTADTYGGTVLDRIDIGSHWSVMGAVRLDDFAANYFDPVKGAQFAHTDLIPSPRAALVYKPTPNASFYFSYGTSFDPSAENLSLSAPTANLGPEKDRTFEFGGKAALLNGHLSLTAAAFNTEMTNARVGDPLNPGLQLLAGNERVNGIELGLSGYITPEWEILAGYTYLNARTTSSTDPSQVGKPLANTAPNQVTFWTTYDLPKGWTLGGGLNYLDQRTADPQGTTFIPSYVTFDGLVSVKVADNLTLQVNGYNLANTWYYANSYYSSPLENHVIPGAGRTVTFGVLVRY
jgi:catecholate siderophore receptor